MEYSTPHDKYIENIQSNLKDKTVAITTLTNHGQRTNIKTEEQLVNKYKI